MKIVHLLDGEISQWCVSVVLIKPFPGGTSINNYVSLVTAVSVDEARGKGITLSMEANPGFSVHTVIAMGLAVR